MNVMQSTIPCPDRRPPRSRPITALWITDGYPSNNSPVEGVFHQSQAEALAALGVKVQVCAPVAWIPKFLTRLVPRWSRHVGYPLRYERRGVEVLRPRIFSYPRDILHGFPHLFTSMALQRSSLPRPDLIHAHFAYPGGLTARKLSREIGVPYVLTLHGSDVHSYPLINGRCRERFQLAVEGASSVFAVGDALASTARDVSGIRPRVLPVGIPLNRFNNLPDRAEARRRLKISENAYVVLYVGRLIPTKGVNELLDAFRMDLPAEVLGLIVGAGPLHEAAKSVGRVRAVGAVGNEQLPVYMAAADCFVLPSYREGLPTVLVEAGASGLPVIGARVDGIRELLDDGRGHLIEPRSASAIAEAVRWMMRQPERAAEMACNLRRHVYEKYDAARNAATLLEYYDAVLNSRHVR